MQISAEKLQAIQDQVSSKIHWDAPDAEVLEWLEERHRITGDDAARMVRVGHTKRVHAIRERALYAAVFAAVIMSLSGVFLWMEWMAQAYYIVRTIVSVAVFFASAVWFLLSMVRLVSGRTDSTIDH